MSAKHAPTPWTWNHHQEGRTVARVHDAEGRIVAYLPATYREGTFCRERIEAHAALIIAAPDMAAKLEAQRELIGELADALVEHLDVYDGLSRLEHRYDPHGAAFAARRGYYDPPRNRSLIRQHALLAKAREAN